MADTIFPVDAVSGSPAYSGRMLRQVNAVAFGGATAARPLGGRSGVRPGTSTSTVTATSTTWTCGPLAGVADVETAAEAGLVTFALDANATGSVTPASASFARQDLIYVQIDIPVEDGSSVPVVTRKYIAGTVASTDPALPLSRAFAIARINVPISGGGSPTVTWIAPYAVATGGILPVASSLYYPASPRVGEYIDDPTVGLLRWNGTAWKVVLEDTGWIAFDTNGSTIISGWVQAAGTATEYGTLAYRVINRVIHFRGIVGKSSGTINAGDGALTIAAAHYPAGMRREIPVRIGSSIAGAYIDSARVIRFVATATNSSAVLMGSAPID